MGFYPCRRIWHPPPPPPPRRRVCPPPLVLGGGHTHLRERGVGGPNSDKEQTLWYSSYTVNVLRALNTWIYLIHSRLWMVVWYKYVSSELILRKTLLNNKKRQEELPPVVIPEAEEVPRIVLVQFLLVVVLRQEGFLHKRKYCMYNPSLHVCSLPFVPFPLILWLSRNLLTM